MTDQPTPQLGPKLSSLLRLLADRRVDCRCPSPPASESSDSGLLAAAPTIRSAIAYAFYEVRESGGTIERAADVATAAVMDIIEDAASKENPDAE